MSNLIEMAKPLNPKKDDRPRRGVVLALEQHFQKYDPSILDEFHDDEDFINDGPEAA